MSLPFPSLPFRSAARDCIPQERNSFVNFQAKTGVEVRSSSYFYHIGKNKIVFDIAECRTVSGVAGPLDTLDKVKAAIVNSQTLEEVARLKKVLAFLDLMFTCSILIFSLCCLLLR
ncbi:hypothetical protein AHAS_Ahas01G0239500 [Arachis hypogaea]